MTEQQAALMLALLRRILFILAQISNATPEEWNP